MTLHDPLLARTQMLIRKPAAVVFGAFVDPAVTTRFWFTKSSGRLAPGAQVRWQWEMYGASADVRVKEHEQDRRIVIEWGEPARAVEWVFEPRGPDATLVRISERGFRGTDDEVVAQALDSTAGFTFVLAGLKALLEHGVVLGLVADHHPDAHRKA
ncbi:MAG TPA: SRPBCC family protein [Planctomycetota bacterium]|nr:SRPBCC family protein [Planctomycetota bacterium]